MPDRRLLRTGLAAALVVACAARASADDECLTFRADRVTLDPAKAAVELEGDVRARCGPLALKAEHLMLRSDAEGLHVDGPGELLFCPCPEAPLSLRFDTAELESSGDLYIDDPALRMGDTTVLWAPWVWLRPADRVGLLAPRVAWRGDEGMLLGPGVHLPWRGHGQALSWIDLYVAGYTEGGFELEPEIVTPHTHTVLRFDHTDGDLIRISSRGAMRTDGTTALAWQADLSRGPRGRSGLVELAPAAQSFDRAQAFLEIRPADDVLLHSGSIGYARRGEGPFAFGPALIADAGTALGANASWESHGALIVADGVDGASRHASAVARFGAAPWAGPLRLSIDGYSFVASSSLEGNDISELIGSTTVDVGMPLVRDFAWASHRFEPFVLGSLSSGATSATGSSLPGMGGCHWLAVAGLRNVLGRGARGLRLESAAGWLGASLEDEASSVVRGSLSLDAGLVAMSARASAVERGGRRGGALLADGAIGARRTATAAVGIESRTEVDPVEASVLEDTPWRWMHTSALSSEGTSLFGRVGVPLLGGWRWEAASDWDLVSERWLSWGSGLVLDHRCGCVRARAWVSRRVERAGTDAWVALSFGPGT